MGSVNATPLLDASQIAANQAAIAALAGSFATHIADTTIHWADAPNNGSSYVRNSLGWQLETVQEFGEYVGPFDASSGSFPVAVNQGDWFNTTVAGTVDSQPFIVGDILVATIPAPSTTTFAGNWTIVPNISVTDHTLLTNIGTNSHAAIDTHIADGTIHFADAPADSQQYARFNNAWAVVAAPVSDHGALTGLADDDHLQYALLAGRAGGQSLVGGTLATQRLNLRGSSNADLGIIGIQSPVDIIVDPTVSPSSYPINWANSFTVSGLVGGMINDAGTITVSGAIFIWALLSENRFYSMASNPGFAAFTLFNALPVIQNSGNFNLLQALVLNIGVSHRRITSGTSTATQSVGVSMSADLQANVSGAVMTLTNGMTGLSMSPTFNTVAGGTVNFGTLIAVDCFEPSVRLFGSSAGLEFMTAYYGLNFRNFAFGGGTAVISVIRSDLVFGASKFFLDHTGTALSRMGGTLNFTGDLVGIQCGASFDTLFAWAGAGFQFLQFNATADQLRFSNPSADRFLFDTDSGNGVAEYNFNCARFSLGAQTGAVGNQVGVFVAGARTATVGGGWSDFLLTQAAAITVNAALSQLFGWTINAPSITLGTGSVVDAGGLLLGGNVSQGTNRYGMLILSNPTGGTINEALRVQNGRTRLADLFHEGVNLGFYGTAPIAQQLAVPVTIGGVHAALVALGLIT